MCASGSATALQQAPVGLIPVAGARQSHPGGCLNSRVLGRPRRRWDGTTALLTPTFELAPQQQRRLVSHGSGRKQRRLLGGAMEPQAC